MEKCHTLYLSFSPPPLSLSLSLVSITEKSGNLRKDLKQDILVSVSTLGKKFSNLKIQIKNAKYEHKKLREEVKNAKDEMARRRDNQLDK